MPSGSRALRRKNESNLTSIKLVTLDYRLVFASSGNIVSSIGLWITILLPSNVKHARLEIVERKK